MPKVKDKTSNLKKVKEPKLQAGKVKGVEVYVTERNAPQKNSHLTA
jgi:hypothetical protein